MNNPVLSRQELRRLPFQRRPVPEPGTRLVFQMPSGELVAPVYPYTTGDVWWRGPCAAFVVDARPHPASFACELPCKGDALHFDATVGFSWSVDDPVAVVRQQVEDAVAECRGHLVQRMRTISRRFPALDSAAAEEALRDELDAPIVLERGLRITALTVELRLDQEQARLARELEMTELQRKVDEEKRKAQASLDQIGQASDLTLHRERAEFYEERLAGGATAMAANLLAQDPTKAAEAMNFLTTLSRQDQEVAIQAMKVILESDQLRIGEADRAVSAAVERFTALLSASSRNLEPTPLTGPVTAPPPMLSGNPEPDDQQPDPARDKDPQ